MDLLVLGLLQKILSGSGNTVIDVIIDAILSETSENPVQNKVVTKALKNKADISHKHTAVEVGADSIGSAETALNDAKEYTDGKIADIINGAPSTLDTLSEIATAMDENKSVVDALDKAIGTKANKADIPTKISELENDSNFLTEHQDLSSYAKTEDIPTELPANGGNADTVNNHTVNTDVPSDAVFTDTVYTLPIATTEILGGVMPDGTTITADENGIISVVNSKSSYRKMTAIIDLTNTNPETCITYAEDAIYLSAKSSDWDDFFGEYPVLLKDGVEVGRLNPNNFNQFEDGTAADTTSGDAGDVMIAFPRRGIRITISDSGDTLIISMTDDPDDPNYTYYAHTRGATRKDVFYLGAYKSYVSDDKRRSLYGKTITANKTIGEFRTYAHNLGEGYENSGFYQLIFRQVMYILKYKNLNSQKTVGLGYYGSDSVVNTGGTYHRGMTWGLTANNKVQVKLFGIEDFWGNMYEDVDGVCSDSNRHILTATDNFNDTGDGYTDQGLGADSDIFGYMLKPQGTSECGFIPKSVEGSSTTGFCDHARLYASSISHFGGSSTELSGAFALWLSNTTTNHSSYICSRLMYL